MFLLRSRSAQAEKRLQRLRAELDDWPHEAGLFGLPDRFIEYAQAEVAAAGREKFGPDRLDAVALREARTSEREARVAAGISAPRWHEAVNRCSGDIAARMSLRHAAFSLALAAAIWGASQPDLGAAGWARLALLVVLGIVNLPGLSPVMAFLVRLPLLTAGSLIEGLSRLLVACDRQLCHHWRTTEERRRLERDDWRATELRALMASYHRRKDLALRAAEAV
jgi:hypothetical protein